MISFFRKKKTIEEIVNPQTLERKITTIWSPCGIDTSGFSYKLAEGFSNYFYTTLIELPCLGVPRLSVASETIDRDNHTEAAIQELEQKKQITSDWFIKKTNTLRVLPSGYYATPELPIANRVELETLVEFPQKIAEMAFGYGSQQILFECQGQISHPMTFYALKLADSVFIPLTEPNQIAFTLLNLKRIFHLFKWDEGKYKILANNNLDILSEAMVIKDDEGKTSISPDIWKYDVNEILSTLGISGLETIKDNKKARAFLSFQKPTATTPADEEIINEAEKIVIKL